MDPSSLTPLAGGWSGETFLADAGDERCVFRVYARPGARGDAAPEVDAALMHLVRGLVPVPDVLEVRRGDTATDTPGLLVTSFVEGVRGDQLLPTLDAEGLSTVGRHLGALAATVAGMPMLRSGPFVDAELRIGSFDIPDGLPEYVEDLGLVQLRDVAEDAQALLDSVTRCSLVHSDFNPKNVLLDPDSLHVTALVDWEFAHAGHPFTDLGNLLRFDRAPTYVDAVLDSYTDRRGGTRTEALALGRAA
ncbi:MAG: phosphotransferase family protein, partial [Nocardioides sp.]